MGGREKVGENVGVHCVSFVPNKIAQARIPGMNLYTSVENMGEGEESGKVNGKVGENVCVCIDMLGETGKLGRHGEGGRECKC